MVLALAMAASGAVATWAVAPPATAQDGSLTEAQWAARVRSPTLEVVRPVGVIDGDTFVARRPGTKRKLIIRNAGIQAMEDRECGKRQAKKRLARLLGKKKIVIASRTNQARTNRAGIWRLQRNAFTKSGRDIQAAMLKTGLVLPYGIGNETLKQNVYATLAQKAALARRGLFRGTYCRPGPVQDAPLQLMVNYDATGSDLFNLGGKFVRIRNLGAVPVPIGKWRLRGAAHDSFYFPPGSVLPAYGEVKVKLGTGINTPPTYFWEGQRLRFFVPGHSKYQGGGAYLFDRHGDIRAWSMYPCRVACRHPARGMLKGGVARGITPPPVQPPMTDTPSGEPSASTSDDGLASGSSSPSATDGGEELSPARVSPQPSRSPSSTPSASPPVGESVSESPSDSQSPSSSSSTSSTSDVPAAPVSPDRKRERVWFTNTSSRQVDLSYTVVRIRSVVYELPLGTVVAPRERLLIFTGGGIRTRLRHFLGLAEPYLFANPLGSTARIRTHTGIRLACVAWREKRC